MGSDAIAKRRSNGRSSKKLIVYGSMILVALGFFFMSQDENPMQTILFEMPSFFHDDEFSCSKMLRKSSAIKPKHHKNDDSIRPIFFNTFPATFPHETSQQLISLLTNQPHGMKSYYVSRKGKLKYCIGETLTAICENVHPIIEMHDVDKWYQGQDFYGKYIVALRNPLHAFPALVYDKLKKYHDLEGHMPETSWIKNRDDFLEVAFWKDWKSIINAWRQTKFHLGMYLVYEDIFSEQRGPQTLKKLALFLQQAGFEIPVLRSKITGTIDEKMQCLWSKLEIPSGGAHDYSDWDYKPGYTNDQLSFLTKSMGEFISEINEVDDIVLEDILQRYHDEIEDMASK